MKSNMLSSVHISDIHFGALDPKVLYNNLKTDFIDKMKKLPKIDVIFIQGDLYDFDLSLNSKHAYYALKAINKIAKFAMKRDIKVRFIKGTKSHDHNQMDIIAEIYESEDIDLRVINSVTVENIDGARILYLPEEYIRDVDSYYESFFSDSFDIVVGHGMIDRLSFGHVNDTVSTAAPIFDTATLSNMAKGYVCLGHIHNAFMYSNIYYTGSFARWIQGEESPKGFIYGVYNKTNNKYAIAPIANDNALIYKSMSIDKALNECANPDTIIKMIDDKMANDNIYKLRLICNEENDSAYMGKLAIVRNYYSDNRSVSIEVKRFTFTNDRDDQESMEELSKYDYIFSNTIDNHTKISRFTLENFGIDLTPQKIDKMLSRDITKYVGNIDIM